MLTLDLIQTVAFAGIFLFVGYTLKRVIPPPVALFLTFARQAEWSPVAFDTALQVPLQNAFLTSVGFGASLALLRRGGPLVIVFLIVASVFAAAQNLVGGLTPRALGEDPAARRSGRLSHADRRSGADTPNPIAEQLHGTRSTQRRKIVMRQAPIAWHTP